MGADVHVALPFYRKLYHIDPSRLDHYEKRRLQLSSAVPEERVHFAKDYIFNYRERVYSDVLGGAAIIAIIVGAVRDAINNK